MSDSNEFCAQCGTKLDPNTKYCPSCGARVPGRNPETVEAEKEMTRRVVKSRPTWAGVLLVLYSVPFLILGLYYFIDAQGITDYAWSIQTFVDIMNDYGIDQAQFESYLSYFGTIWTISGAAGVVSAILCFTRRFYYVALVLCMISAILAVSGLFALLLGLLAFWFILSSKLGFREFSNQLEENLEIIK